MVFCNYEVNCIKHFIPFLFIIFSFFLISDAFSQSVSPKVNAELNFNTVILECNDNLNAEEFTFFYKKKEDTRWIVLKKKVPSCYLEKLEWGAYYQWKYQTRFKNNEIIQSDTLYFRLKNHPCNNINNSCFEIKNENVKNTIPYISLESLGLIIDTNFQLSWYLPQLENELSNPLGRIRDLEILPGGDVSYLYNDKAYIANKYGEIKWKSPTINNYNIFHHEFDVTYSNHKFLLTEEEDSIIDPTTANLIRFSTDVIIEINEKDSIIWEWHLNSHINKKILGSLIQEVENPSYAPRANGFCISKDQKYIYLSVKDISSIFQIEYATGKIIQSIGYINSLNESGEKDIDINYQHGLHYIGNSEILLFNNNATKGSKTETFNKSEVFIISFKNKKPYIKWNYMIPGTFKEAQSNRMGYSFLFNNNILNICLGVIPRVIILEKETRNILFEITTKNPEDRKPIANYRSRCFNSLYPNLFDFKLLKNSEGKNEIRIWNGSKTSSKYQITIEYKNGKILKQTSGLIKYDETKTINIIDKYSEIKRVYICPDQVSYYTKTKSY